MRKISLIMLMSVLSVSMIFANANGYFFSVENNSYQEITGTAVLDDTADDNWTAPIDLGFIFNYDGNDYSQILINANGFIRFGTEDFSGTYSNDLASTTKTNIVAGIWDDLKMQTGGAVSTFLEGDDGNRIFTVQWKDARFYGSSLDDSHLNFQIKLFENNGSINLAYGTLDFQEGKSSSIGINDLTGGAEHFLSVTPGDPATTSSTSANNTINEATYLTSGTTYIFSITSSIENDLAAVSLSGNQAPTVGNAETYTIQIKNNGSVTQNDYSVKLMKAGDVEIASINGTEITSGQILGFDLDWTPDTDENTSIYGKVVFTADEVENNNQTSVMNIAVQPEGVIAVTDGDGVETGRDAPVNFLFKSSLIETIYFSDELNVAGSINSIQYHYNFTDAVTEKPLHIWMGETTQADLSAGWIPSTELTQVFDGNVTIPATDGNLLLPLTTPFNYGGGNLVIMVERPLDTEYFDSTDQFYLTNTEDSHPNRTRYYVDDTEPADPTNPPADSQIKHTFANTTFFITAGNMGSLEGIVKDTNNDPVEGVNVAIDGTNLFRTTDENGVYSFENITTGTYDLTASKIGYENSTATNVEVTENNTTTQDFIITQLDNLTISGHIVANDDPNTGLENVNIILTGAVNANTTSDSNGDFTIGNIIPNQTYNIVFSLSGYANYITDINVESADLDLGTITLNEIAYPVSNVVAENQNDSAVITWNAPTAFSEFRYDDGTATGQLGFGDLPNAVLGAVHRRNATISQVKWLLTSNAAHTEAEIFILGLDAAGLPDATQILHHSQPQPNVDDEWNTYNLPETINAPNGFFVGICTPNIFTALGTDDGVGEPYVFQPNTQYGISDYTDSSIDWLELSAASFPVNFTVRAYGDDLGPVGNDKVASKSFKDYDGEMLNSGNGSIAPITPKFMLNNNDNIRSLQSYTIYRLTTAQENDQSSWTQLATGITELTYTDNAFSGLDDADYKYAVVAVYSNDVNSEPILSNILTIVGNDNPGNIPALTKLNKNYPNPFNPETTISYSVKNSGPVSIDLFNILGQKTKTLINENKTPGKYKVIWKGLDQNNKKVASGIYFYRMKSGNYTSTHKMILMK